MAFWGQQTQNMQCVLKIQQISFLSEHIKWTSAGVFQAVYPATAKRENSVPLNGYRLFPNGKKESHYIVRFLNFLYL